MQNGYIVCVYTYILTKQKKPVCPATGGIDAMQFLFSDFIYSEIIFLFFLMQCLKLASKPF